MRTPFRNDVDALKTRLASLGEEMESLRARAREYEEVKERLAGIEQEHEAVRKEIDERSAKHPTTFLDTLRIASPCHERWDDMIGDGVTRFCASCQKNVHNVSEMTRDEAEAFLESVAGPVCIRMYKRHDGTVITADCPVGVQKKRVKRLVLVTVGSAVAAAAGAIAFWRYQEESTHRAVMGEIAEPLNPIDVHPPGYPSSPPEPSNTAAPAPERDPQIHMGAVAPRLPDQKPTNKTAPR